jgi:hypothetical protein
MKKYLRTIAAILAIITIYIGFRFVTQAGQGLGVIQNDGYAGTGGVLILLGGIAIGWLATDRK